MGRIEGQIETGVAWMGSIGTPQGRAASRFDESRRPLPAMARHVRVRSTSAARPKMFSVVLFCARPSSSAPLARARRAATARRHRRSWPLDVHNPRPSSGSHTGARRGRSESPHMRNSRQDGCAGVKKKADRFTLAWCWKQSRGRGRIQHHIFDDTPQPSTPPTPTGPHTPHLHTMLKARSLAIALLGLACVVSSTAPMQQAAAAASSQMGRMLTEDLPLPSDWSRKVRRAHGLGLGLGIGAEEARRRTPLPPLIDRSTHPTPTPTTAPGRDAAVRLHLLQLRLHGRPPRGRGHR